MLYIYLQKKTKNKTFTPLRTAQLKIKRQVEINGRKNVLLNRWCSWGVIVEQGQVLECTRTDKRSTTSVCVRRRRKRPSTKTDQVDIKKRVCPKKKKKNSQMSLGCSRQLLVIKPRPNTFSGFSLITATLDHIMGLGVLHVRGGRWLANDRVLASKSVIFTWTSAYSEASSPLRFSR